jgi:hypothetical protein
MRISKEKFVVNPASVMQPMIMDRRKELIAAVQAALKVGAGLGAREAGRRAFSEFLKLGKDGAATDGLSDAAAAQIVFASPSRRRDRLSQ